MKIARDLEKCQVGFLTYDLQSFTEDCLYRVSCAIAPVVLKAYPVIYHPHQEKARFPYFPSSEKGRHFGVDVAGSTPEGLASNLNWRAAWKCVRESDIVVLFGLQGVTALLTGLLRIFVRRTMISVNQTLPVSWERKRRWWIRWLKKWLLNRCSFYIYQTPVTKEVLTQVYGIPEKHLFYAPFEAGAFLFKQHLNNCRNSRDSVRQELGINNNTTLFLFVGNLVPFKGIPDLIEAVSIIPKDKNFLCAFAGPEEPSHRIGGTIKYYMDMARRFKVEQRMRFLGNLSPEKLASMYWAVDVVVLPTRRDMFSKVLVEGALASKPLITTNACGAAGTIVINGDNGFVIEPGDTQALAEAMARLLDSDLRKMMGKRSMEIVENFCDLKAETEGYVSAIRHALASQNFKKI